MENIEKNENEKIENKDSNKELESTIRNIMKEVASELLPVKKEDPKIELISDGSGKEVFQNFMQNAAQGNIKPTFNKITNFVTLEVPKQISPLLVPKDGAYGKLSECSRAGDLVSDTFTFMRTVDAGSASWITKNQRSTNSLTGNVSANSTNVAVNILDFWVSISDTQLFSGGFDVLKYVQDNANLILSQKIDAQIFAGTGSPFVGIYGHANAQTVTLPGAASSNLASFTLTSARAMVAQIEPMHRTEDLKWYVDYTEEKYLTALGDTNNTYEQIANKYTRLFGSEIVPMSTGVLNTAITPATKHFVLANLKNSIQYADAGMQVEAFRTTGNVTDFRFYWPMAMGNCNPNASSIIVNV